MYRPPSIHTIIRGACVALVALMAGTGAYLAYTHTSTPPASSVAPSPTATMEIPQATATHAVAIHPSVTVTQASARPTVAHTAPTRTISTPTPRPKPTAAPTQCQYVNCNPWGYNFTCCNSINAPPSNFCSYFKCDANFWNGTGYVSECKDGYYEMRYGQPYSCAGHGGDWRLLLKH